MLHDLFTHDDLTAGGIQFLHFWLQLFTQQRPNTCTDYAMRWAIRVANPGRDNRLLFSPKCPLWLWDAPSLLFKKHGRSFPEGKTADAWIWPLSSILCRWYRMTGVIPLLSVYALMASTRKIYLLYLRTLKMLHECLVVSTDTLQSTDWHWTCLRRDSMIAYRNNRSGHSKDYYYYYYYYY